MFVKDYLSRSIMDKFGITEITGAFIVDCIANWDPTPGSQVSRVYMNSNAKSLRKSLLVTSSSNAILKSGWLASPPIMKKIYPHVRFFFIDLNCAIEYV